MASLKIIACSIVVLLFLWRSLKFIRTKSYAVSLLNRRVTFNIQGPLSISNFSFESRPPSSCGLISEEIPNENSIRVSASRIRVRLSTKKVFYIIFTPVLDIEVNACKVSVGTKLQIEPKNIRPNKLNWFSDKKRIFWKNYVSSIPILILFNFILNKVRVLDLVVKSFDRESNEIFKYSHDSAVLFFNKSAEYAYRAQMSDREFGSETQHSTQLYVDGVNLSIKGIEIRFEDGPVILSLGALKFGQNYMDWIFSKSLLCIYTIGISSNLNSNAYNEEIPNIKQVLERLSSLLDTYLLEGTRININNILYTQSLENKLLPPNETLHSEKDHDYPYNALRFRLTRINMFLKVAGSKYLNLRINVGRMSASLKMLPCSKSEYRTIFDVEQILLDISFRSRKQRLENDAQELFSDLDIYLNPNFISLSINEKTAIQFLKRYQDIQKLANSLKIPKVNMEIQDINTSDPSQTDVSTSNEYSQSEDLKGEAVMAINLKIKFNCIGVIYQLDLNNVSSKSIAMYYNNQELTVTGKLINFRDREEFLDLKTSIRLKNIQLEMHTNISKIKSRQYPIPNRQVLIIHEISMDNLMMSYHLNSKRFKLNESSPKEFQVYVGDIILNAQALILTNDVDYVNFVQQVIKKLQNLKGQTPEQKSILDMPEYSSLQNISYPSNFPEQQGSLSSNNTRSFFPLESSVKCKNCGMSHNFRCFKMSIGSVLIILPSANCVKNPTIQVLKMSLNFSELSHMKALDGFSESLVDCFYTIALKAENLKIISNEKEHDHYLKEIPKYQNDVIIEIATLDSIAVSIKTPVKNQAYAGLSYTNVSIDNTKLSMSLTTIFMSMNSIWPIMNFERKVLRGYINKTENRSKHHHVSFNAKLISSTVDIPSCEIIEIRLDEIGGSFENYLLNVRISSTSVSLPRVISAENLKLLVLDKISLRINIVPKTASEINFSILTAVFCVFHKYKMYHIFLGASIAKKCILRVYDLYFCDTSCDVQTYCEEENAKIGFPNINIVINRLRIVFTSDKFADRISRNYVLGSREQLKRLGREEEFERIIKDIKFRNKERSTSSFDSSTESIHYENEDEYQPNKLKGIKDKMHLYNYRIWKKCISDREKETADEYPKLLTIDANMLRISLRHPKLSESSIKEHIHRMDPLTSRSNVWSMLAAINLDLSLRKIVIKVRDYPHDILNISSNNSNALKCDGIVIFSEKCPQKTSRRIHVVDLDMLKLPPIRIARNINPLMIYHDLKMEINSSNPVLVTVGAAYDPSMSEVIDIIDNFTLEKEDPSPPLGWWDKIRLSFHGKHTVNLSDNTDIYLRVIGSFMPHFRSETDWGSRGLELVVKGATTLVLDNLQSVSVDSSGLIVRLMKESYFDDDEQLAESFWTNKILMRLAEKVKINLKTKFITVPEDNPHGIVERTHDDIQLICADYVEKSSEKIYDSYEGFRTHRMRLVANLMCRNSAKEQKPEDNIITGNFLRLFDHETTKKLHDIISVYQPPLVYILTKPKHRRATGDFHKPVLLSFIESMYATIDVHPLMAVIASERDEFSNIRVDITTEACILELFLLKKCPSGPIEPVSDKEKNSRSSILHTDNQQSQWTMQFLKMSFSKVISWIEQSSIFRFVNSGCKDSKGKYKIGEDDGCNVSPQQFIWSEEVVYTVSSLENPVLSENFETGAEFTFIYPDTILKQKNIVKQRIMLIDKVLDSLSNGHGQNRSGDRTHTKTTRTKLTPPRANLENNIKDLKDKKRRLEEDIETSTSNAPNYDKPEKNKVSHGTSEDECRKYKHEILVHNVKILWNPEIRNMIYNITISRFDRQNSDLCKSNIYMKSVNDLLETLFKKSSPTGSDRGQKKISVMLKSQFSAERTSTQKTSRWTRDDSLKLLEKLVATMEDKPLVYEYLLPNSRRYRFRNKQQTSDISSNSSENGEGHHKNDAPNNSIPNEGFNGHTEFIPDRAAIEDHKPEIYGTIEDPFKTGMYPHMKIIFINPQICFDSNCKDGSTPDDTAYLCGSKIISTIHHHLQENSTSALTNPSSEQKRTIIKTIIDIDVNMTQIYLGKSRDITAKYSSSLDYILDKSCAKDYRGKEFSRIWIPLECIIDASINLPYLKQISVFNGFTYRKSFPNEMYTKFSLDGILENIEKDLFIIPRIKITFNSDEFFILQGLFANLLLYESSRIVDDRNNLKDLLIVIEQLPDFSSIRKTLSNLTVKTRNIDLLLRKYAFSKLFVGNSSVDENILIKYKKLCRMQKEYQKELEITVKAVKNIHNSVLNVSNDRIYKKVAVKVQDGTWILVDTDEIPFMECKSVNFLAGYAIFQGRSLLNYLELDYFHVKYLKEFPFSDRDLVAAYAPKDSDLKIIRNKLLRIYWKENPPVSGIKVVSHFEINLSPISLKLTYNSGKTIWRYFFLNKKYHHHQISLPKGKKNSVTLSELDSTANEKLRTTKGSSVSNRLRVSTDQLFGSYSREKKAAEVLHRTASTSDISSISTGSQKLSGFGTCITSIKNILQSSKTKKNICIVDPDLEKKKRENADKANLKNLKEMQARAKVYCSFIYVKITGTEHCLSYRRSNEKSFEDIENFVLYFPTLEFRNKTWSWPDFFEAVKKELIRIILVNTGSIVKEKIFAHKKSIQR